MCASPVIRKLYDVAATMSEDEWAMRVDLAACYRLVAHFGMDDLFATHVAARAPGDEAHFLLNPYGMHFSEITASSLVKVDLEGNIVQDTEHVVVTQNMLLCVIIARVLQQCKQLQSRAGYAAAV